MISIEISDEIKQICPDFSGVAISGIVTNSEHSSDLWKIIDNLSSQIRLSTSIDQIKENKAIAATRTAYKQIGKDPNRYRPSSEALYRRILRDLPLYQIDTLVDIINLVSIKSGYSIGGFDVDKISGDRLLLGIGNENEPYDAIGRGQLNIHRLPVYRDDVGGIGTPTSDNERTKLDLNTTRLLTIINGYDGDQNSLKNTTELMLSYLKDFANLKEYEVTLF